MGMSDKSAEELRRIIAAYDKALADVRDVRTMAQQAGDEGTHYALLAGGRAALDVLNAGLQAVVSLIPGEGQVDQAAINIGKRVVGALGSTEKSYHADSGLGAGASATTAAGEVFGNDIIKAFGHLGEMADAFRSGNITGGIGALKSAEGDIIKFTAELSKDATGAKIGDWFGVAGNVADGVEGVHHGAEAWDLYHENQERAENTLKSIDNGIEEMMRKRDAAIEALQERETPHFGIPHDGLIELHPDTSSLHDSGDSVLNAGETHMAEGTGESAHQAAGEAAQFAQSAHQHEQEAGQFATQAHQHETEAATAATQAHQHETEAATAATQAHQHETEAATAATQAHQHETEAATAATQAHQHETEAATAVAQAHQHETEAATA